MTTEKPEENQADTPELGPFGPPDNKFVFQWYALADDSLMGINTEVARVGGVEGGGCIVRTRSWNSTALCFVPGVALGDFGIDPAVRCKECGSADWADYAVDGVPTGKRYCSNCQTAEAEGPS